MKAYKLTIDLATLKHLGIGLYSNIPAVLSEVVANSWDANARKVDITIDEKGTSISVKDDGWGMTEKEIN
ncbi:MAG: ATP-binding protein, partial [Nitrospira sp.]